MFARSRVAIASLAFIAVLLCVPAQAEHATVGAPAPDFTATTLDGKELHLSDFRGQVLVVNF